MRFLFLYILIFSIAVISCKSKNNLPPDFIHANWTPLDSSSSYLLYNSDEPPLTSTDSISILFEGKQYNDSITNSSLDSLLCTTMAGFKFGKFKGDEAFISAQIKIIKSRMHRHSFAYIRWFPDTNTVNKNSDLIMNIYLKKGNDSLADIKLASGISKESFVSSYEYTSNVSALKKFGDQNPDIHFKEFITENPLPASIDIAVKPEFANSKSLDSIKQMLLTNPRVFDISYPDPEVVNFKFINTLLHKIRFIIKVSS